jgi:3-deoxy-7-phosphoheptulonate synthase/chorismate mutase
MSVSPAPTQPRIDPDLRDLRERVSEVDRAILAAVNLRLELVAEIAEHKRQAGIPTYDPIREEAMLRELTQGNRGRLTDEGVAELLASILYLTKRQLGIASAAARR